MGKLLTAAGVFAVSFAGLGTAAPASASCQCQCVNGQVKAMCSSSIDLPPICSPRICPIVPPSVKPIATPIVPPVGTRSCSMQQVLNPSTGRYEWKQVCR